MKYPDSLLDDIRAKVRVSDIVGRKFRLRKEGHEFRAVDDNSLTINDSKGLWWDHAKNEGGDCFKFLTDIEGLSFPEAVQECASIAGIHLPDSERPSGNSPQRARPKPSGNGKDRVDAGAGGAKAENPAPAGAAKHARKIDRTYDYTDAGGTLLYQVVRFVFDNGGKTFAQRRKAPDGKWIWGLDVNDEMGPLEFMSKGDRDWIRYDEDKYRDWKYDQRTTFPTLQNLEHGLYRLPELTEALAEDRVVFLTEGEKDVETLADWGVPATTNSGGAKHWGGQDLSVFAGADVVVAIDNDPPGRERADIVGASLKGIAKRVRILDLTPHWTNEYPPAPKGADVTDWRDQAGGTVEHLYNIVKGLPDWRPAPPTSKFGRVSWADQDKPRTHVYDWWIKGLIAKRQTTAIIGPMGCGKSFETFGIGAHIATGQDYRGQRTKQGLVIFCAPEGGAGVVDRMKAYRMEHGLLLDGIPFEALTHRFNLFAADTDLEALIAEVQTIKADWPQFELAMLIIDTWSAATTGMDENASKDVSLVRSRIVRLEKDCNCGVLFVHHMNAAGERQRGHSSITADVESVLEIKMLTTWENKKAIPVLDDDNRPIRRITNFKQREAITGQHWDFVLKAKEVRKDADGDKVTSCVSVSPARAAPQETQTGKRREGPKGDGFHLNRDGEAEIFSAILRAIDTVGEAPPPGIKLPPGVQYVARWSDVGLEYRKKVPNDEGDNDVGRKRHADMIKSRLKRARKALLGFELISIEQVGGEHPYHVVWPTGKKVWGQNLNWPAQQAARSEPSEPMDLADFYEDK